MGRRARRRGAAAPTTTAVDHQARVRVTDDVWGDFKIATGGSISRALGRLVDAEVDRYRSQRITGGKATDYELVEALARAEELAERVATLVARLERLRDRPPGRE